MRFYALRLHEVGMIQSSPNAILAEGTVWRFLNELKRELRRESPDPERSSRRERAGASTPQRRRHKHRIDAAGYPDPPTRGSSISITPAASTAASSEPASLAINTVAAGAISTAMKAGTGAYELSFQIVELQPLGAGASSSGRPRARGLDGRREMIPRGRHRRRLVSDHSRMPSHSRTCSCRSLWNSARGPEAAMRPRLST